MSASTNNEEITSAALAASELADGEVTTGKLTTIRINDHLQ